jgi:DNA-directed RNA polymerase specialized sigma24 family protein
MLPVWTAYSKAAGRIVDVTFPNSDDLVHDALVQTFKRIEDFEPRGAGAFQGYLRQAALNRLRDELRRRARMPEMAEMTAVEIESGEARGT